jgi:hypothetical protein
MFILLGKICLLKATSVKLFDTPKEILIEEIFFINGLPNSSHSLIIIHSESNRFLRIERRFSKGIHSCISPRSLSVYLMIVPLHKTQIIHFKNLITTKLTVCIRSLQFDIFVHIKFLCIAVINVH